MYNTSEYLGRCLESIIGQTYPAIEVILVDDGSTDDSPAICDRYVSVDRRIKVIHGPNAGLSCARNTGINASTGDFLIFVDSDDYIDTDTCQIFLDFVSKSVDVIRGKARTIDGNQPIRSVDLEGPESAQFSASGPAALKHELRNGTISMAACFNLYRRGFIVEHGLFFKEGILHEDEHWTPRVFLESSNTVVTHVIFYNYSIRQGSITRTSDKTKNALDIIETVDDLATLYAEIHDDELRTLLMDYLVTLYMSAIYVGRLHRSRYRARIDAEFLRSNAARRRTKWKVAGFLISPTAYYHANKLTKLARNQVHATANLLRRRIGAPSVIARFSRSFGKT